MKIIKVITLILAFTAFMSQSMANDAFCRMDFSMDNYSMNKSEMQHDMSAMNHQMMDEMHVDMPADLDCCAEQCSCAIASCSSIAMISAEFDSTRDLIVSAKILATPFTTIKQHQNSLYRPPINS